jgi:hypothetical protein
MDTVLSAKKKIERLRDEKGRWIKSSSNKDNSFFPIKDLVKLGKYPYLISDKFALILQSKKIPNIRSPYGGFLQREITLPDDLLIIENISNYGYHKSVYIRYLTLADLDRNRDLYLPEDFAVALVTKDHPKYSSLLEKMNKYEIENMEGSLYYDWDISSSAEIFAEDENGNCIPAFLFLPDKKKAKRTPGGSDHRSSSLPFGGNGGHKMYHKGFSAKFDTIVAPCLGHHMDSIAAGMAGVHRELTKKFPNGRLSLKPFFSLDKKLLSEKDKEFIKPYDVKIQNAYGLKSNLPSDDAAASISAHGAINFHIESLSESKAIRITKALDKILGVACVSLFNGDSSERRKYALPGEFRLTERLLSYRGIANTWLCHPVVANLVIDLARKVVIFSEKGYDNLWEASEKETLDCLFSCDVKKAKEILTRNKKIFKKILHAAYVDWIGECRDDFGYRLGIKDDLVSGQLSLLFSLFSKGITSFISNPTDLASNWKIGENWIAHHMGSGEPNIQNFIVNFDETSMV